MTRWSYRRRAMRALAAVHLTEAAVLLISPSPTARVVAGPGGSPPSWLVRVLGARTVVQGAAEAMRPTRGVFLVGIAVDITHAASMLLAARIWPQYRRAALASAGAAATSAAGGVLLIRARR